MKDMNNYAEIAGNLTQFKERILELEDQFDRVERFIIKKEIEWHSTVTKVKRELRHSRNILENLKEEEKQRKKDFINIVENFKLRATNEEYRKLETKIDHWDIDKFITRDEFMRLLNL